MAISKTLVVYMLLPALVSCDSANLRGTTADGTENRSATNETDDVEAALFNSTDVETPLFNGTDDDQALQASATKVCSSRGTTKANQCLMARAKKANEQWNSDWTYYDHSDNNLGSRNLRTDCSGFVHWAIRGCLEDSIGKRALRGITTSGPQDRKRASDFYKAFGSSRSGRWCRVEDFRKVGRGDVLVYEINPPPSTGDSGHIMIAWRSPFERGVTSDGKLVFAQKIVDSTSKPHFDYLGFTETRSNCDNERCGAGVGYVYVWTDTRGHVLAMRLRGKRHRNHLDCYATKDGRRVEVPCFPQSNYERHNYRIGRLRK